MNKFFANVAGIFIGLCLIQCGSKSSALLSELPAPSLDSMEAPLVKALQEHQHSIEKNPIDADAWGRYGMLLHIHQFYRPALICFNIAKQLKPLEFRWHYLSGLVLQALDDPKTESSFLSAQKLNPNFAPVWWRLGQAQFSKRIFEAAKISFRRALDILPNNYSAQMALAQTFAAQDSLIAAENIALQAVIASPNNRDAYALIDDLRRRSGKAPDSLMTNHLMLSGPFPDPYDDTIISFGVTSYWHRNRAVRFSHQEKWAEAAKEFQLATELRPQESSFISWIEALGRAGNFAAAEREAHQGLLRFPTSTGLINVMGFILAIQKKYDESIPWYRKAISASPSDPAPFRNLVISLIEGERYDEAKRFCSESRIKFPYDLPLRQHCFELMEILSGPMEDH